MRLCLKIEFFRRLFYFDKESSQMRSMLLRKIRMRDEFRLFDFRNDRSSCRCRRRCRFLRCQFGNSRSRLASLT